MNAVSEEAPVDFRLNGRGTDLLLPILEHLHQPAEQLGPCTAATHMQHSDEHGQQRLDAHVEVLLPQGVDIQTCQP